MNVPTLTEKRYRLMLSLVPGIGTLSLKKLLVHFGSAQAVFEAARQGHGALPQKMAQRVMQHSNPAPAQEIMQSHEDLSIQCMTIGEKQYPKRLLELPDRPLMLYYKGEPNLNLPRVVSIVGTRQVSAYGKTFITRFLEQLLPYKPLVISGLAYGTDVWVHQEALAIGLPTAAVLPSSLDKIYPKAHQKIAMQMCLPDGGLITEYPMGSVLGPYSFVARNRIVAGLADVTIVVEAKIKSGALLTAYYANSYHREVFALPGNIYLLTSGGCHQLIKRNQAHLLTDIGDLVCIMNWELSADSQPKKDIYATYAFTPVEQAIVAQLQQLTEPIEIDVLLSIIDLPLGEIQAALLALELQGIIQSLPGKRFVYVAKRKPCPDA